MTYTLITGKNAIGKAFKKLKEAFEKDAEPLRSGKRYKNSSLDLNGEFKIEPDPNGRYWIEFQHTGGTSFCANVRKNGPDEKIAGLFIQDESKNRYLAHSGKFNVDQSKRGPDAFRKFTGPFPWVKVKNRCLFIVARIDDIKSTDLARRIDRVTRVVANFKDVDPKLPCKLDRHSPLKESENPEMDDSIEDEQSEMARGGQGYGLSSKERKVVENHAMKLAKKYYKNEGYQVEDTSRNNPYDLRCSTEEETIFIEVKGSTGSKDKILLTKNEVDCANKKDRKFELFVVSEIEIDKNANPPKARGGKRRIIKPWKPKRKCLTPVTYSYNLVCHDDS